ncbi:hypothetical protein BGC07_07255 [Piscirickettsia litoralis]|uniref:ABC-2 type transporter transmembrane domain-containing protein n=2 Tax=Piscirickettsia litoralis TaxID=1891921 RepID=A0ABX3A539_9GAMM|nr:hypothetical protein BGC07_07255 [Piscirickettsia litoralis]
MSEVLGTPIKPPANLTGFIHFNHPNAHQDNNSTIIHNVSAWAVFGMFFIIIPAAGTLLRERDCGVLDRIFIAPAHKAGFLLGKMLSYLVINLCQLLLMFVIAYFIFPLLHLPALELTSLALLLSLTSGLVISITAACTAILLGSWLRSYEQVSSIGSLFVIVAAAIGGIMVPTYLMPENLQLISHYSPLYWAQQLLWQSLNHNFPSLLLIGNSLLFAVVCFLVGSYKLSKISER